MTAAAYANQVKLAMAVGRNRRYEMNRIAARHWLETAHEGGIDAYEEPDELGALEPPVAVRSHIL